MSTLITTQPSRAMIVSATAALAVLALEGCRSYSPNSYSPAGAQQVSKVDLGVVESYRAVDISEQGLGSGIGAGAGAAAGGLGGSSVGHGVGSGLAALGGALVGGAVGLFAEHAVTDTQAFEYIVRKQNGDLIAITQKDAQPLGVGQRVRVIYGVQARIIPEAGAGSPPAAPKPGA